MTLKKLTTLSVSTLALALALVACSGSGQGAGAGGGSEGSAGEIAVQPGQLRGEDASVGPDGVADAETSVVTSPGFGPRIIQTASLRLVVPHRGFDRAVEEARNAVGSLGGFVISSAERRDPGAKGTTGTLVLRVPERSYADAMRRLGDIGRVSGRQESGQDVSAELVDLESRKRHLEAVEAQLLKLLDRADDVAAALAVQAKLDEVQLRLEETRGRLRFLGDRTAFATISLALREQVPGAGTGKDEGGILDAWAEGARAFANVAGQAFVFLATIAPILLLVALLGLVVRAALRRGLFPRRSVSGGA